MSPKTAVAPAPVASIPSATYSIALAGNPNSGKTTLFNLLTGLNQKVGNYPGVTVDRKSGRLLLEGEASARLLDLPGTYSIYPRSNDEQVVLDVLLNRSSADYPDVVVAVADMSNLERSLLLVSQILDLGLPLVLVLNMADMAKKRGITVDTEQLSRQLGGIPVVVMNARNGQGLQELKQVLSRELQPAATPFYQVLPLAPEAIAEARQYFGCKTYYEAYLLLQHAENLHTMSPLERDQLEALGKLSKLDRPALQITETKARYARIQEVLSTVVQLPDTSSRQSVSARIDAVVTHKIGGYLLFFGVLFLMFQAIFAWATVPMDLIDSLFARLGSLLEGLLPEGVLSRLLIEGVLPGIGGIVIFVPQIALLFMLIALLEESGYMARVVFLMDKLMRKVGLNGRSVVPLISGLACAVPAIMATRGIDHWKDRLITIFVTPFMSCSARLPVYTILIALVVPDERIWGFINLQGIALMGMYLLGFVAAIGSALLMKFIIRAKKGGFLIMELPAYRWPRWGNVLYMVLEKSKVFVFEAGKIILAVSIILWVLASYGPGDRMARAEEAYRTAHADTPELEDELASLRLEHSYAGLLGKTIEPAIAPLGYDWKIGIALFTSFAAREVFVGTMATLYSVGSAADDESTIKSRLQAETNPDTGGPRFTLAVAFSLLVFYAFAMQCTSTVAVVYRETGGWKWPLIQTAYMTGLAYVSALLVYQLLS
ncbi:ferrous iron transport protein B [Cesiribacter andamanensis]|uniref:Ferrous iron transport protein B n=1 Tax=Cesiribacter andamanensis AMV16 TaxID=1279009 RepID=M7N9I8_9BACT|nr:ferrous iron transport protein B [Cesiribacter andamanensis]EMR03932.1 Ferrous iron transport protein B [Cesiribacter andamanensis AMV16]